jgi:hypothetical protein
MAISAWLRDCQMVRQISSGLMVLNMVSTIALKLLHLSSVGQSCFGAARLGEDFANDVSLETADNLTVALPLLFMFADIGKRWWMVSHPNDGDAI